RFARGSISCSRHASNAAQVTEGCSNPVVLPRFVPPTTRTPGEPSLESREYSEVPGPGEPRTDTPEVMGEMDREAPIAERRLGLFRVRGAGFDPSPSSRCRLSRC